MQERYWKNTRGIMFWGQRKEDLKCKAKESVITSSYRIRNIKTSRIAQIIGRFSFKVNLVGILCRAQWQSIGEWCTTWQEVWAAWWYTISRTQWLTVLGDTEKGSIPNYFTSVPPQPKKEIQWLLHLDPETCRLSNKNKFSFGLSNSEVSLNKSGIYS